MAAKRSEATAPKAPRKPAIRRRKAPAVAHDAIAVRAYYMHLEGGHDPVENWVRAERELAQV